MTKSALPKTIHPSSIITTDKIKVGVAPVTQPAHKAEFWYVATIGPMGWETRSVVRVNARNGQNLETEVRAWADQRK